MPKWDMTKHWITKQMMAVVTVILSPLLRLKLAFSEISREKAVELCGKEAIDELDDEADGSGYYIYYTTGIDFDDDTDWITFTDGSAADCYGNLA